MYDIQCQKCGEAKPRTAEFWEPHSRTSDGLRKTCRACMQIQRTRAGNTSAKAGAQRRYRERNKEKRALLWANWYARNRETVLTSRRRYRQSAKGRDNARVYEKQYREKNRARRNLYAQAKRYGLSFDSLRQMVEDQDGCCAICAERPKQFHVDHDHATKKVRALLCSGCNVGLGRFRDRIDLLERARDYLIVHSQKGDQLCLVIGLSKKTKP